MKIAEESKVIYKCDGAFCIKEVKASDFIVLTVGEYKNPYTDQKDFLNIKLYLCESCFRHVVNLFVSPYLTYEQGIRVFEGATKKTLDIKDLTKQSGCLCWRKT